MACKHGAKGYLLETSQAELIRVILGMPPGSFLIEPALTVNIVEYLTSDMRLMIKEELLTPREKEIVGLLREEIQRSTIAEQLNISGATLKTHIKNIFRKTYCYSSLKRRELVTLLFECGRVVRALKKKRRAWLERGTRAGGIEELQREA